MIFNSKAFNNNENQNAHLNNSKWVADNDYNVFEKQENDKWVEELGGEPTFAFDQVRVNNANSVLLFDPKREVFVELNDHDSKYGDSQEPFRHLYNGRWSDSNNDENNNSAYENQFNQNDDSKNLGKIFFFNYKLKNLFNFHLITI
jgi:hypothetical protein